MVSDIRGEDIQPNNNWAKVHNLILEALCGISLAAYEYRVVLFILRMTYGYGKKEDKISERQIENATGIERRNVQRTLVGLEEKRIIYRRSNGAKRTATIGFNKYVQQWTGVSTDSSRNENLESIETPAADDSECDLAVDETPDLAVVETPTKDKRKAVAAAASSEAKGRDMASEKFRRFVEEYERITGLPVSSSYDSDEIKAWADEYSLVQWQYALLSARDNGKRNFGYIRAIMRRLRNDGLGEQELARVREYTGEAAPTPEKHTSVKSYSLEFVEENL